MTTVNTVNPTLDGPANAQRPQPAPAGPAPHAGTAFPAPPALAVAPTHAAPPVPAQPGWARRVNWRIVFFVAIVGTLVGWPLFTFLRELSTGGIVDHGTWAAVDLKALGNFAFDQTNGTMADIPERYRKLDGRRVVMEGEIAYPDGAGDRIGSFLFVYNIQKCCNKGPPQVQERVFAAVPGKKTVPWDSGGYRFRVTGVLHVAVKKAIDPKAGSEKISSVYTMDVEKVEAL